jgi:nitrate/nitrite-specific signal transduction histidine kinase
VSRGAHDGLGLPKEVANQKEMGLNIVNYRASRIGEVIDILSAPGKETTIICVVKKTT